MLDADKGTIEASGQQIAYVQSPGDGRPVIFVHGNSASARTWDPLLTGSFGHAEGSARASLASIGAGRFADEVAIVAALSQPLVTSAG